RIMYFCGGHYRQPLEFEPDRLAEASSGVERVTEAGRRLAPGDSPPWSRPLRDAFFEALARDFNTAAALAPLFESVRQANRAAGLVGGADLREMLSVLGLENLLEVTIPEPPDEVKALSDARERARGARDWPEADRLREQL